MFREILVYGTNDGARCREARALLETRDYAYQDVRVDEDLSTRFWLQRTTGDDALAKIFVGSEYSAGFAEQIMTRLQSGNIKVCWKEDP